MKIDYEALIEAYKERKAYKEKELVDDLISAVSLSYGFNEKQSILIYDKVYADYHSHFNDVFGKLYEVCDFYFELKDLAND